MFQNKSQTCLLWSKNRIKNFKKKLGDFHAEKRKNGDFQIEKRKSGDFQI